MPSPVYPIASELLSACIFMGSAPREVYGQPGVQDHDASGTPRWVCQCAVGLERSSEVLDIGISAHSDPAADIPVPSMVTLTGLRLGISAPALKDGRVTGGRPWFTAESIAATGASSYKPSRDAA